MADCIFCMIANKEIPSNVVYEDEQIVCFHDLEPQAPVHVLIIPKKHITTMDDVKEEDKALMGHLMVKVHEIAEMVGYLNVEHFSRVFKNIVGLSPKDYQRRKKK